MEESSAWLYRSGMKMVITKVELDQYNNIVLEGKMDCDQVRVAMDRAPKVMKNGETKGIIVCPDMDNIGYESVIRDLSGRRISVALDDRSNSRRRDLLETMMTVQHDGEAMEVESEQSDLAFSASKEDVEMEIQGKRRLLTGKQAQILQSLGNEDLSMLVVQAPAGTGKTHIISLHILKLLERSSGVIFVTAPTNLAVQEISEKVFNDFKFKNGKVLFLQSIVNEIAPQQIVGKAWKRCRIPEVLQAHLDADSEEVKTRFIASYTARRLLHDGNGWKKEEALKTAVELQFTKLVCATVPMLRMFIQVWEEYFDMADLQYLIIDESGLSEEVFLFTFIAHFPNIKQVLLTGDEKQLPPYTSALTDNVISLGYEGII